MSANPHVLFPRSKKEKAARAELPSHLRARQEHIEDAVCAALKSPEGRLLLRWFLRGTRLTAPTYTGEALSSAHGEGARSVGVALVAVLQKADPHAYAALVLEDANDLSEDLRLRAEAQDANPDDEENYPP